MPHPTELTLPIKVVLAWTLGQVLSLAAWCLVIGGEG
jgi:hypothetical protein